MRRELKQTKCDRHFQLWEYLVSHGQLLIRSPKTPQVGDRPAQSTNVDLIFVAVEYIGLPHSMNGLELIEATAEEDAAIRQLVEKPYLEKLKVYVLLSEGKRFYVMGIFGGLWENDWDSFESPLEFHHVNRVADAARPIYSVRVRVNAPPEWVFDNGFGPFDGVLVDHTPELVVIKLLRSIKFRGAGTRLILAAIEAGRFQVDFAEEWPCKLTPIRNMELFSVDPTEVVETAKNWASYEKTPLTGSLEVLSYNPRYIASHL